MNKNILIVCIRFAALGQSFAVTVVTQDTANLDFAIVWASTQHRPPKAAVVTRYENGQRVILRTDASRKSHNDHIF